MAKPIALAADHGGFELKEAVKAHLKELGLEYIDFGNRDECRQWLSFKNDPGQICLDCYDTFVTNIVIVVDIPSSKIYTYSGTEDNYIEFILNMSK